MAYETKNSRKNSITIGGAKDPNAVLHVQSTTKASIPSPTMTEAERDLIPSPQSGMQVYNLTAHSLNVYNSALGEWEEAGGGAFKFKSISSSVQLLASDEALVDTTSGVVTLTLPDNPQDNTRVRFVDAKANFANNNLVIQPGAGAASIHNDGSGSFIIDVSSVWGELVYVAADNNWFVLGPLGQPYTLDAGSGSGEKNYIENPSATQSVSGWTASAGATVERTVLASLLPRARTTGTGIYIHSGVTTEETVTNSFQLDTVDVNRMLKLSMDMKPAPGYNDDEIEIVVTDTTNAKELVSQPIKNSAGNVYVTFVSSGEDVDVTFRKINGVTSAGIVVSDMVAGPGAQRSGPTGGWKTYDENDVVITADSLTSFSVSMASLTPYKDPITNRWRMAFNFTASHTTTTYSGENIRISGVTFHAVDHQSVSVSIANNSTGRNKSITRAIAVNNDDRIVINTDSVSSINLMYVSGDVSLDSKPTWADFDNTVQYLTPDSEYQNFFFKTSGLWDATGTIPTAQTISGSGAAVPVTGWYSDSSHFNNATGGLTIPADGNYRVNLKLRWNSSAITGDNIQIRVAKNGSLLELKRREMQADFYPVMSIIVEDSFVKGDIITAEMANNSGVAYDIGHGVTENSFVVSRIPDTTSGQPVGSPLASSDKAGLVSQEYSIDLNHSDITFGSGSGVWTVSSGDLSKAKLSVSGKNATLSVRVITSSLSVASSLLWFTIPSTILPPVNGQQYDTVGMGFDAGAGIGNRTPIWSFISNDGGDTKVSIARVDGAKFSVSTNLTYLYFTIPYII